MFEQTVPYFIKMLKNLDALMGKAVAHADRKKFDVNVLVGLRLTPDMLAFSNQIQFACDTAKFCTANLTGKTAPKHEDNEKTWTELRERIKKTQTYLETFGPEQFAKASDAKVSPAWAEGKWLPAKEYVNEVAIPNFYFHISMAYAILRQAGVEIGKSDYMGELKFRA